MKGNPGPALLTISAECTGVRHVYQAKDQDAVFGCSKGHRGKSASWVCSTARAEYSLPGRRCIAVLLYNLGRKTSGARKQRTDRNLEQTRGHVPGAKGLARLQARYTGQFQRCSTTLDETTLGPTFDLWHCDGGSDILSRAWMVIGLQSS